MATNVHLTAELESFARACVESGRYNNVSEVMRAGLRLLQREEEERLRFLASLDEAEAEADRDGTCGMDEVSAEIEGIIAPARR